MTGPAEGAPDPVAPPAPSGFPDPLALPDPFALPDPRSREEILDALRRTRQGITASFARLPLGAFFAPQGDRWSPAEHLLHLIRSVRPLARGLGLPRPVLALRFGVTFRGSRSYDAVGRAYREALARGVQAGSFAPSPDEVGEPGEGRREEILRRWDTVALSLEHAVGRWGEGAMDRIRLPHPALGRLTVREMLFFTLYHDAHHARLVLGRWAEGGPPPETAFRSQA